MFEVSRLKHHPIASVVDRDHHDVGVFGRVARAKYLGPQPMQLIDGQSPDLGRLRGDGERPEGQRDNAKDEIDLEGQSAQSGYSYRLERVEE